MRLDGPFRHGSDAAPSAVPWSRSLSPGPGRGSRASATPPRILVIDDDPGDADALAGVLRRLGFDNAASPLAPDLGRAELETCGGIVLGRLRQGHPATRILARLQQEEACPPLLVGPSFPLRVSGQRQRPFVLGAFLTGQDLGARLRSTLQRPGLNCAAETNNLPSTRSSSPATAGLTRRERTILSVLSANAGRVLSRRELVAAIWGYRFDTQTNTLDVHLSGIRSKLDRPGTPSRIQGVRGLGLVLIE